MLRHARLHGRGAATTLQDALASSLLVSRWRTAGGAHPGLRRAVGQLEDAMAASSGEDVGETLTVLHHAYNEMNLAHEGLDSLARSGALTSPNRDLLSRALGMAAFSLQMQGSLGRAEEHAHRALGCDETNLWAVLALLEVHEKLGRSREAMRLLRELEPIWTGSLLEPIFAARQCVFLLEQGALDACLRRYDDLVASPRARAISTEHGGAFAHWVFAERASVLLRMRLAGVSAQREMEINTQAHRINVPLPKGYTARKHPRAHDLVRGHDEFPFAGECTAFDGVFAGVALLAAAADDGGKQEGSISFLSRDSPVFAHHHNHPDHNHAALFEAHIPFLPRSRPGQASSNDVAHLAQEVGVPVCSALLQTSFFTPNAEVSPPDAARGVRELLGVRHLFRYVGGTDSQRDVLNQLVVVEAIRWAMRAKTPEAVRVAKSLTQERIIQRPGSAQSWMWHSELLDFIGESAASSSARTRAMDMGLGQGGHSAH